MSQSHGPSHSGEVSFSCMFAPCNLQDFPDMWCLAMALFIPSSTAMKRVSHACVRFHTHQELPAIWRLPTAHLRSPSQWRSDFLSWDACAVLPDQESAVLCCGRTRRRCCARSRAAQTCTSWRTSRTTLGRPPGALEGGAQPGVLIWRRQPRRLLSRGFLCALWQQDTTESVAPRSQRVSGNDWGSRSVRAHT
jgi:hypothetical protein